MVRGPVEPVSRVSYSDRAAGHSGAVADLAAGKDLAKATAQAKDAGAVAGLVVVAAPAEVAG